jgi:hypothetical protein
MSALYHEEKYNKIYFIHTGRVTNCMAALSTYMYSTRTDGYSDDNVVATFRHNLDVSKTFALSTTVNTFLRANALEN